MMGDGAVAGQRIKFYTTGPNARPETPIGVLGPHPVEQYFCVGCLNLKGVSGESAGRSAGQRSS